MFHGDLPSALWHVRTHATPNITPLRGWGDGLWPRCYKHCAPDGAGDELRPGYHKHLAPTGLAQRCPG